MKRLISLVLCIIMLLSAVSCANTPSGGGEPAPEPSGTEHLSAAEQAKAWIEKQIEENTLFSFKYDGAEFSQFIGGWEKKVETSDADNGPAWTVGYTSPEGVSVRAEITLDNEFAALDWCCYFENSGSGDSPVISEIQAVDALYEIDSPVLTTANGSTQTEYDFEPIFHDLTQTPQVQMMSSGGRSSDGAFPYFDICNGKRGVIGAIGWTGNWKAAFDNTNGMVRIKAGMSETSISMHAGEDMRTPSIVLAFFTGDQDAGHNNLRQLILKSYTPSDWTGEPIKHLPLFVNTWGSSGEDTLMSYIRLMDRTGLDYEGVWVDAGWYGEATSKDATDGKWYGQAGNWYFDEDIYPNGLKVVSDELHGRDKQLLLWFEPERAGKDTKLLTEHPEFYLPKPAASQIYLYNMGDDEAAEYLTDLIDGIIKENGIDWYRQDFNCAPYETWRSADNLDGENRVGMTEIKYITNLYRYIDTLLERNPGLMMDNCAAGGRRLDIEMMKRSVPLWRTDYSSNTEGTIADGVRNIGYNLTWWLPMSSAGRAADGLLTDYQWRCLQGSGMSIGRVSNGRDQKWYFDMIEQYYKCRELMTGDYYILTAGWGENLTTQNAVYEFFTPETGLGYIMAFRPSGSLTAEDTYVLKGLDPDATYLLEVQDTGDTAEFTGEQLMVDGLSVTFASRAESQLIYISEK